MSLYPVKKSSTATGRIPQPPSGNSSARVPLSVKLGDHVLGLYIRGITTTSSSSSQHHDSEGDAGEHNVSWKQIVAKCHHLLQQHQQNHHNTSSEKAMHHIAHQLSKQFPILPKDLKPSEKRRLLLSSGTTATRTSSSTSSNNNQHQHHPLDVSPRELLTPRGKSMFPPLQKLTPRTSSSHESFRTKASTKLLHDEEHYSPAKAPPPMILTHTFGKANSASARRQRNQAAIHQAEVLALNMALPHNRPVDVNRAVQYQQQHGTNNNANQNIRQKGIALNPNQLSAEEIEQIIRSVDGSASSTKKKNGSYSSGTTTTAAVQPQHNHQRAAAQSSSRYGPYFTSSSSSAAMNNNNSVEIPHMSDEMMDRIRDRHRALRTKQDLDRAMELRRQQLEARKSQHHNEICREKERSVEIAHELEEEKNKKLQKRMQQQAFAEELKMAEKRRVERNLQAQREKQHYAALANEMTEKEKHQADVALAVQRHRREEAAKVNLMMANERRRDRIQQRRDDQHIERELLAYDNKN